MKLRAFCSSDAVKILEWISSECEFRMWSADRFGDYPISPDDMAAYYDEHCKSGSFFPMTAVDENNNVLGHLILRYTNEEKNEVRVGFVIVDSSARNRGVGRSMLELAKTYAVDVLRAETISLGVFENNLPARKCYAAAGFCESEDSDEVYNVLGEKWRCVEMKLSSCSTEYKLK